MTMKITDLTGMKFGLLTAIEQRGRDKHEFILWAWQCDCGAVIIRPATPIKSGKQVSCGCHKAAQARLRADHGYTGTPTYKAWISMRARCAGTHSQKVDHHYHGRGIKVCERWQNSFHAFLSDMGERPVGKSIERIDNNGDYEPGNCRWATQREQTRNTRRTVRVKLNGEELCLKDACARIGVPYNRVRSRIRLGWNPQAALDAA